MKNIITYILVTALLAGVSACTDLDEHLVDRYSKTFVDSNHGVGNKNNVNKAQPSDGLQGAFSQTLNGTAGSGGFFAVEEIGTDEAVITQKGGDWYDGGLYIRMHHHEFSPQTWAINDVWNNAYSGILQCNDLLGGTVTADQKAKLRTLRAYFYWRLIDVFGNVPIVVTKGVLAAQSTRPQVFAFIESELWAALPDLPAGRQDYGRVSKGAANALLARLYLNHNIYRGTAPVAALYDSAINAADRVINSGVYSLATNYADVFGPANCEATAGAPFSAPDEMIFVAPFDEATGTGAQWAMMTLHYPSQLTYKFTSQPWNGWATLEDFYNSYEAADKRRAANFVVGPQYIFGTTTPVLDVAFDKADADGAPLNFTPFINELFPNSSRQGGARFGKFSFKIGQNPDADNDFPLLRYGEVLLNKAEALQRKSGNFSDGGALALVNQLRTRAGVTPFASMTAGDMLAERGRELFSEALRRPDLIRFGAYGDAWWENPGDSKSGAGGDHILMAIPIEQMQASGSTAFPFTQNPGY
jgi:hypothetical protein